MIFDEPSHAVVGPRLVVRDRVAAAQWERCWAEARAAKRAWITPPFVPYRAWRRETWAKAADGGDPRLLIEPHQSAALWRQVVENSPAGRELLNVATSARWAAQARQLLADWRIDAATLRAGPAQADYRALLQWIGDYRARLGDHGWVDEAEIIDTVLEPERTVPEALTIVDQLDPTPAQQSLLDGLRAAGWSIARVEAPAAAGRAVRVPLRGPQEEIAAAAAWAASRIGRGRGARVAVVVRDLDARVDEVQRTILDALDQSESGDTDAQIGLERGTRLGTRPLVGAAVNAIELLSPAGTFATLSRWLRSPFFGGDALQARSARAEARLRARAASQLTFLTAYHEGGLRADLEEQLPEQAERIGAGLRELRAAGDAATPTVWARVWSRALEQLGWPAPAAPRDDSALRAWDDALAKLAQLTAILGEIPIGRAIDELRALCDAPAAPDALPRRGVHVLASTDSVGPGYDAVWVLGLSDQQWPESGRSNPLLPRRLQTEHGMPWASPRDTVDRAQRSLARLLARANEVVLSWPATLHDYAAQPSPLIRAIPLVDARQLEVDAGRRGPARERAAEQIDDPAPRFEAVRIDGGARTLNLQARCPVRAFCEVRLHARALEPPARGLTARLQGIAMHRALELLVREHPSQQALQTIGDAAAGSAVRECAERALREVLGAARRPLSALLEIERDRITVLIESLLALEKLRPPFRVARIEDRAEISVGRQTITCRIDRVDELDDGSLVLIDYKTGRAAASPNDWFRERLTETQLPLYALELGASLAAMMIVSVSDREVAYQGVAVQPETVAPKLRPIPENRSFAEQRAIWRAQIRQLVDEFVAGDTRFYSDGCTDAQGAYAPLTRVYASITALSDIET